VYHSSYYLTANKYLLQKIIFYFRDISLFLLWLFLSPIVRCKFVTYVAIIVFSSVEYPPQDGRNRLKCNRINKCVCIIVPNYSTVVGICVWWCISKFRHNAALPMWISWCKLATVQIPSPPDAWLRILIPFSSPSWILSPLPFFQFTVNGISNFFCVPYALI
jgi:hypothetical protein